MNQNALVYGLHAVAQLVAQTPERIQIIYVQSTTSMRLNEVLHEATIAGIPIETTTKSALDKRLPAAVHQGIIAVLKETAKTLSIEALLDSLNEPAFLLVLDGVQDPHNLGACLRVANAAGVHAVIAPKDRAVGITPVVRKVAAGAAELTPFITVTNLARTIALLKEHHIWVYGAAESGSHSIYTTDLRGPVAIVLGAEGSGLRRLTEENCDQLMRIPTVGTISSLNVAVATGICLFEAVRQRGGASL